MPTFLWSGKTSSGKEEVDRISADTPESARKILEDRGWTDLRQETMEIHDFAKQQVEAASNSEYRPNLTPKEELAFLKGTGSGLGENWLKAMRESAGTILLLTACLVWAIYRHRTWGIVIPGGCLFLMVFLFPALHFWFGQSQVLFQKLHKARNWRRWDEVFNCLEKLQRSGRLTKIGIGETPMAQYRALALAGTGRLDEAVSSFQTVATAKNMPRWLFHSQLASVYTVAKQYDQGLECYRLAMAEAVDKSIVWLDMGNYLVERFDRPEEAKQLLALAESAQLVDLARSFLPKLRAKIAYRENDFAAMDRHLREALASDEKQPAKNYYLFEPSIMICKGYLAVSSAALGNKDAARAYFAESEKYLSAICLDELLAHYHALMKK